MLKHARKTLHTVKWSARQYSTYSKDDSTVSSFKASKAFDVVYVGTFIGTGASSMYGVWSIINSSLIPINEKLEKLDAKVGILDLNVNYIKGYLRIQEIAPKTNDSL
ncbi:8567_t:CDS:2 [Gigaspora rosea]|nr:8567_t:CDS:2 [Gigaspora rosea]